MAQPANNPKIEELRYRLKIDPKSRIFFPLAEELRKLSQLGEAEQVLRAGLANHPAYLSGWVSLGRVLRELGSNDAAIEALKKAIQLDPGNVVAARLLGDAYLAVGQNVEAIKKYKLVLALMPADEELVALIDRLEDQLNPIITVIPPRAPAAVSPLREGGAGEVPPALSPAEHPFEAVLERVPEPTAVAAQDPSLFDQTAPYFPHRHELPEVPEPTAISLTEHAAEGDDAAAEAVDDDERAEPVPLAAVDSDEDETGATAVTAAAGAEDNGPWVDVTPWSESQAASPWDEPVPPPVQVAAEPFIALADEAVVFAPVHEVHDEQQISGEPEAQIARPVVEERPEGLAEAAAEPHHAADVPFPTEPQPATPDEDTTSTITMADLYAGQGLIEDARNIYENILRREPGNETVRRKLAAIEEAAEKRASGDARRRKIVRLEQWLERITGRGERRV